MSGIRSRSWAAARPGRKPTSRTPPFDFFCALTGKLLECFLAEEICGRWRWLCWGTTAGFRRRRGSSPPAAPAPDGDAFLPEREPVATAPIGARLLLSKRLPYPLDSLSRFGLIHAGLHSGQALFDASGFARHSLQVACVYFFSRSHLLDEALVFW